VERTAAEVPEANLQQLWFCLDAALVSLETQQQLQVAGDYPSCPDCSGTLTLEEIESVTGLPAGRFFDKFVRQSMHVDFAQFIEFNRPAPACQRRQQFPMMGVLCRCPGQESAASALEEEDEQELNSEHDGMLLDTAHVDVAICGGDLRLLITEDSLLG